MILFTLFITLALLAIATISDLRTREVPDWISAAISLWGFAAACFGLTSIGWAGSLLGLAVGFALGAVLFYLAGLGGADAKLIAAIGAVLGPVALLFMLFWMAIAGGGLAILAAIRGQRDYAYVPAIAVGFIAYWFYPGGIWRHLMET